MFFWHESMYSQTYELHTENRLQKCALQRLIHYLFISTMSFNKLKNKTFFCGGGWKGECKSQFFMIYMVCFRHVLDAAFFCTLQSNSSEEMERQTYSRCSSQCHVLNFEVCYTCESLFFYFLINLKPCLWPLFKIVMVLWLPVLLYKHCIHLLFFM